ncbi:MAG: betA [Rhodobacteraceae bacterium]|uniref:lycopene cyclase family protein n=1 Tax=Cypionkella sp. TaxID=2811411 RepID=UPI0013275A0B|nr:lycopene cyclase family protein [Cypionkella sp.]KAF0175039.1 MAG: betA [Paracoccaceae bacterium]MDO8325469.1 GMC family oxidoreductase N-terminal domain-containing protein [Cypionkella sp.]
MAPPDYIIVGAGPAGCVLASRLTEAPTTSVLLLEAGGSDRKLTIAMPAAIPFVYQNKALGWTEMAGPAPFLDGQMIDEKRGRVQLDQRDDLQPGQSPRF